MFMPFNSWFGGGRRHENEKSPEPMPPQEAAAPAPNQMPFMPFPPFPYGFGYPNMPPAPGAGMPPFYFGPQQFHAGGAPMPFWPPPYGQTMPTGSADFHGRPKIPLAAVLAPVRTSVAWVPAIQPNEGEEAVKQKERELNHDFSEKNIEAEQTQLANLPKTIKRLKAELGDAEVRLVELQTLEPHWEYCIDARRKQKMSTHAGKRKRLTPQERDEAAREKRAVEQEDGDFVAPEGPVAAEPEKA
jgi:hypothetical protein